jgi:polar amino acid transport system substrate-binding protein
MIPTLRKLGVWALLVGSLMPAPGRADSLDDVLQRKAIRWGADQEGGGPYIYPSPDDPNQAVGVGVDVWARIGC